ncbi:hypothetical protein TcWFU_001921 [Taenia crassiceps]|uniref:Uncharacterized protein n=1 Tax=Taenia crassiceps TaxID=6207 RepID=A0ABR4QP50_9CEST
MGIPLGRPASLEVRRKLIHLTVQRGWVVQRLYYGKARRGIPELSLETLRLIKLFGAIIRACLNVVMVCATRLSASQLQR